MYGGSPYGTIPYGSAGSSTPPATPVFEDSWHQALSQPSRFRVNRAAQAALASTFSFNIDPALLTMPEAVTTDRWYVALSQPSRFPKRLQAASQQFAAYVEAEPFAESVSVDRWMPSLSQPSRFRLRLQASEQQFTGWVKAAPFAEEVPPDRWLPPLSQPSLFRRRLPASEQMFVAITNWPVILVGYSFGADIAATIYTRLSDDLRARIRQVSLLGLSREADYAVGFMKVAGGRRATIPAVDAIDGPHIQCFHGADEGARSGCNDVDAAKVQVVEVPGGHHFDGDYDRIASLILEGMPASPSSDPIRYAGMDRFAWLAHPVGIRWPNDVEAGGRKLGGILPERVDTPRGTRILIGVGLNVESNLADAPADVRTMAVSLAELRPRPAPPGEVGRLLDAALFLQVAPHRVRQLRFDQFHREIRRRCDQHEAGDAVALAGPAQLLDEPQRDPAAHGRADEDLPAMREGIEHREAFRQPARNGAVLEASAALPMSGIIVTGEFMAGGSRPCIERLRLGARHVGFVAAEPDEPRRPAVAMAYRDRSAGDLDAR